MAKGAALQKMLCNNMSCMHTAILHYMKRTDPSHTPQCRAPVNVLLAPCFPPQARSSRSALGRRNRVRQEARWYFRMSGSRGAAGKRNHVRQEARWHFRASGSRGTVSGEIASDTKHVGISGRERAKAPWANEIACDRKHVGISGRAAAEALRADEITCDRKHVSILRAVA